MRSGSVSLLMLTALCVPSMASAQGGAKPKTTEQRATGIVTQPLKDFNISRDPVPQVLLEAEAHPYDPRLLTNCATIAAEVGRLDAVLGADVDTVDPSRYTTGDAMLDTGGDLLLSLIPFRGIIREVTGANANERRWTRAIYAGVTRRSFLKGAGRERGCLPPAAPNPPQLPYDIYWGPRG